MLRVAKDKQRGCEHPNGVFFARGAYAEAAMAASRKSWPNDPSNDPKNTDRTRISTSTCPFVDSNTISEGMNENSIQLPLCNQIWQSIPPIRRQAQATRHQAPSAKHDRRSKSSNRPQFHIHNMHVLYHNFTGPLLLGRWDGWALRCRSGRKQPARPGTALKVDRYNIVLSARRKRKRVTRGPWSTIECLFGGRSQLL